MTFMQKLMQDHPEITQSQVIFQKCPVDYGYEPEIPQQCFSEFLDCAICWYREMTKEEWKQNDC